MSIKKSYLKSKNICRVTFRYPAQDADRVHLVGDFNAWDTEANPMKKSKSGFSATLELEPGREYQFRYLVNGEQWENDDAADRYAPSYYPETENSVIAA